MLNLNKEFLSQINRLPNTRARGYLIETLALQYLTDKGIILLKRNFNCRLGEIDIIGLDNGLDTRLDNHKHPTLVFVEVRFRKNKQYGGPLESIDWRKQQKLIRTAHFFLKTHPRYANTPCRFDVVAVTLNPGVNRVSRVYNENGSAEENQLFQIEWIKSAFCLS